MPLVIKGKKVTLRPMRMDEREIFFQWAVSSDATPFWYGKLYGDEPPSRKRFFKNWKPYYFDGSRPGLGRCFVILVKGRKIGQINYNKIEADITELDTIIPESKEWGKGYGSDAIGALTGYLFGKMGVKAVWIAAHRKNRHAIRAYRRGGLTVVKNPPAYVKVMKKGKMTKDDWVVLMRRDLEIRKATEKDIPAIKKLWDQLIGYHRKHFGYGTGIFRYKKDKDALYLKFLKKQLRRRNAAVFVAEKDGEVVGHVMVEVGTIPPIYVHSKQAFICEIIVDEKHRGRGIGSALLKEAEAWAKKKGLYSMGLMVHAGNKYAFSAYKSFGFEENHLKMAKIVK